MKFLLRVLGTWLLALALILLVVDGTKVLASGAWAATSISALMATLLPAVWASTATQIGQWPEPLSQLALFLVGWPAWAVVGGLALALLILGRKKKRHAYSQVM